MSQNKIEIVVAVDAKTGQASINGVTRDLENLGTRGKKSMDGLSMAAGAMATAFGAWQVVDWGKQIIRLADNYQLLEARLKLVTKSAAELADTQSVLFSQSQDAGVAYANTVELYTRLARSTDQLNVSQTRLLNITDLINKSMIVSGASAQEAGAALIQFSQGLASGALRGDELRSVMEQTPRLTAAIADGLGVTIGQLRKMGEAGELTAEKVLGAIERSGSGIRAEFDQMPTTVGRALTEVSNSFGQLIDTLNESTNATGYLSAGLETLSGWLDVISNKSGEARKTTTGAMKREVLNQISQIKSEISANRDTSWELFPDLGGRDQHLAGLADQLDGLNAQLNYLNEQEQELAAKTTDGMGRATRSTKEQTAAFKEYQAAMAATLSGEAAELDKISKAYDARRDAVEEMYKGQATSQQELNDLSALDAAEQRDRAAVYAKTAEEQANTDEKHLKDAIARIQDRATAEEKAYDDWTKLADEKAKTEEKLSETMGRITLAALPAQARAVESLRREYSAMYAEVGDLFDAGLYDEDQAEAKIQALETQYNGALKSLADAHRGAAKKVETVWDSAGAGLKIGFDEWKRSGELTADSLQNTFGSAIRGIVADWLEGMATMEQSSAKMKSIGGTAAIYSTMAGSTTGASGYLSAGVGIANELFNPGAYGSALSSLQKGAEITLAKFGAEGMADSLHLMTSTAFGAATAGIGTLVSGLLSGQDFDKAAVSGAGSGLGFWAGTALAGGNPIGGIIGSFLGSQLGGLLGGGEHDDRYNPNTLDGLTDNTWSRFGGFDAVGADSNPRHYSYDAANQGLAAYTAGVGSLQEQFDSQVDGLKSQMSDAAWGAFAASLEGTTFDDPLMDRKSKVAKVGETTEAMLTEYAAQLDAGLNAALTAALPVLAQELTADNATYQNLSASVQEAITALIDAPSFTVAQLDQLTTFFSSVEAAITTTRQPINDIISAIGKNDLELGLDSLQEWYEARAAEADSAKGQGLINDAAYTSWMDDVNLAAGTQAQDLIDRFITPVTDQWRAFFTDIAFSDLAPSQSAELYLNRYNDLKTAASSGEAADITAFQEYITAEFLPKAKIWDGANYQGIYDQVMQDAGNQTLRIGEVDISLLSSGLVNALAPLFEKLITQGSSPQQVLIQIDGKTLASAMIAQVQSDPALRNAVRNA